MSAHGTKHLRRALAAFGAAQPAHEPLARAELDALVAENARLAARVGQLEKSVAAWEAPFLHAAARGMPGLIWHCKLDGTWYTEAIPHDAALAGGAPDGR